MTKHLFIPDVQAKDGVPLQHLEALGNYIVQKQPEVIICAGDFADMPSLSSYDVGKKSFEGRMYTKDIESARLAMDVLLNPIKNYNLQQSINKKKQYKPRMAIQIEKEKKDVDFLKERGIIPGSNKAKRRTQIEKILLEELKSVAI